MKTIPKSVALPATKQIGHLLRSLRKQRRLTSIQLAERAGTSQSKISKIENGYPGSIDAAFVEKLLTILEPEKTIRQQLSVLLSQLSSAGDSPLIYHFTDAPDVLNQLQKTATVFRCYVVSGISAVLQIPEYRAAYLKRLGFADTEVQIELGKTIERQEALWDTAKTFYIVMPEMALYTRPADARVQTIQIDRLERTIGLSNVHIGIIPTQAGFSVFETGTFLLYDENVLHIITGDRGIQEDNPDILVNYLNAFDELSHLASFDNEARPLLRKASDYFNGLWK
ncbi:MAG TPA: Scr1 family TA system antitoxin-like transcriptional regulator [Candidatus Saccharimonadales bacterium]